MARVKSGRVFSVENKDRKLGSALNYNAVWVENQDGRNERCLLFTENELKVAKARADKNREDLLSKSGLTDFFD